MNVQLQASNNVLLAQIESKGLTVDTHCRSGFCGMCRVRLLEGQVAYDETPIAFVKNRCDLGNLTHPEEPFLRVGLLYPLRGESLCLSIPKLNKSHTVMLPL